jgi:hypothetical protein
MLASIIEIVASIATVIGSIYLIMFMVSIIIPSIKTKWKGYLVKALFFYGIVALIVMVSIIFQVPV